MSEENQIPLRDQVIAYLNHNEFTKASFDRIIANVQGATTYEVLRNLVNENQDIFRSIIIKGGFEGLAMNHVEPSATLEEAFEQISHEANQLQGSITSPGPDHEALDAEPVYRVTPGPATAVPPASAIYPADDNWRDISSEEYREYTFRNEQTVRVNAPLQLQTGTVVEGRVGGPAHYITSADGVGHHIPAGWLHLSWKTKAGREIFNF